MKFRTEIFPKESAHLIDYKDAILFIGSCFSVNIHNKLHQLKFNTVSNPFGIVYNPISLSIQLNRILDSLLYTESDLYFFNEKWLSFDHHGEFSSSDSEECLNQINARLEQGVKQLKTAKFLFITLGTAWIYTRDANGKTVSNCHKIPAKEFTKKLAGTSDMVQELSNVIERIKAVNSEVQVILSISPVRHLSDGHFENQLSKGRLFDTVYQLKNQFENVHYFQAYELMMDDLRDYRFYNTDLIHPSNEAIEYIWEKFKFNFINASSLNTISQVEKIISASNHRPFNSKSEAHQKFIANTIQQIEKLAPGVYGNFQKEIDQLRSNE
ncbi:GSCFA domain-containing protein [bacterium SCSIO 12643]|nr:GSCFA domain-containing protein [bacterium SCSIO 12643]